MPNKPKKLCAKAGCCTITDQRYCDKHTDIYIKEVRKKYDKQRPAYHRLYGLSVWATLRNRVLSGTPFCIECAKQDIIKLADVVDHIVDHRGDVNKFLDINNLQALCKKCHDRKTARTVGWGKGKKKAEDG